MPAVCLDIVGNISSGEQYRTRCNPLNFGLMSYTMSTIEDSTEVKAAGILAACINWKAGIIEERDKAAEGGESADQMGPHAGGNRIGTQGSH